MKYKLNEADIGWYDIFYLFMTLWRMSYEYLIFKYNVFSKLLFYYIYECFTIIILIMYFIYIFIISLLYRFGNAENTIYIFLKYFIKTIKFF